MKDLLLSIQQRLQSQVPALRYIDEDWQQLKFEGYAPVQYPCALIDISQVQWNPGDMIAQDGLLTIQITIADQKLTKSSAQAPAKHKQQAFAIHDLLHQVHLALHGFTPTEATTELSRTATKRIPSDIGLQEYIISYTCLVYEYMEPMPITPPYDKITI